MKYPHRMIPVSPGLALAECACGATALLAPAEVLDGGAEDGDNCPVTLRQHIADLSWFQVSVHKAVSAERAAVVAWLRGHTVDVNDSADAGIVVGDLAWIADCIERGEHRNKNEHQP